MIKFIKVALYGLGAAAIMSAIVNIVATYQLIEKSDEQSLGVTRGELVVTYIGIGLVGVGMCVAGFFVGRKKVPPKL